MNYKKIIMEFILLFFMGILLFMIFSNKTSELLRVDKLDVKSDLCGKTFDAEIKKIYRSNINNTVIEVEGLAINDSDHRESFIFVINSSVNIVFNNEKVSIDKLDIAKKISITYLDEELSYISPIRLNKVVLIEILENM